MKKVLLFCLIFLIVLSVFCSCGAKNSAGNKETAADSETGVTEEETEVVLKTIPTPYADLKVPDFFFENVDSEVTSEDPYTLTFRAKADNAELFSVVFGSTGEIYLGTLKNEDEIVPVYANIPGLDSTSENYEKNCDYQECVNDIMHNLEADYDFVDNEDLSSEEIPVFDIETPLVTLKYPEKWKDKANIEVLPEGVKFSTADGTPLFDLMFVESEGYVLGTYNGNPIYMVEYPVNTEEQIEMQEDVNVILQYLLGDDNFAG